MTKKANGKIIWLFGRPCAGKTSISSKATELLMQTEKQVISLDGDVLRQGANKDLGFSIEDRDENVRRAAEMAKAHANEGFLVICSFITPTNKLRKKVLEICKDVEIQMVYVKATLNVCIDRDTKGLYRKALLGEIKNFTGIDSPFDEPDGEIDCITINTYSLTVDESVNEIFNVNKGKPHFRSKDGLIAY